MLEFFSACMSRRSTHPVLLVRSELDAPIWISPQESLKLAVGECDFTCCETNHLGPRGDSKMECSRKNVRIVLNRIIEAKAKQLFKIGSVMYGRWTRVLKHWWLRGLDENQDDTPFSNSDTLKEDFKAWLEWNQNKDGDFFDRQGVSLLVYAVSANNLVVAKCLLDEI